MYTEWWESVRSGCGDAGDGDVGVEWKAHFFYVYILHSRLLYIHICECLDKLKEI